MRRAHAALYSILSASLAAHALAGPPGDYGDAPVGNNGQGINAYPGVPARWDTPYNHTNTVFSPQYPQGAWLNTAGANSQLGAIGPTTRNDSTMNPALPENDCAPVILLWSSPPNPGSNPLAEIEVTVTTGAMHDPANPVYVNIWIDQNRDGQWKDGYYIGTPLAAWNLEWAVQDVPVLLPASTLARVNTAGIRLENPLASVWVRVMVSDEPVGDAFRGPTGTVENFWDSTMTAAHNFHGEIEDHLLSFQNTPPGQTPVPGVWYRVLYNGIAPPPGGAKPACDLFYKGPWRVFTPKCAGGITFPLIYTSSDRNGGCGLAPALWGMYGLKHVAGIVGPPTVNVAAAFPVGAVMGAVTMACPMGGAPALPAAMPAQGARMASMTVPVASITGPGRINIFACYPDPPKRFRAYRAFFNHFTCGSIHAGRTVFEYPETGVTLAAATVGGAGQTSDYCDFEYGGLEEDFVDPIENRPFPDPDFRDYTFNLHSPGSQAQLVTWDYVSAPNSLFLAQATYLVRPTFPEHYEAAFVELMHRGSFCTVMLMTQGGDTMVMTLPETPRWEQVRIDVPEGFRLDSIVVETPGELNLDNVYVELREIPPAPPPPACDPDVNCDGAVNGFDVEATEQAVNGDFSNFCQDSADLNGDGAENGFDIETEEQRVNGTPC